MGKDQERVDFVSLESAADIGACALVLILQWHHWLAIHTYMFVCFIVS